VCVDDVGDGLSVWTVGVVPGQVLEFCCLVCVDVGDGLSVWTVDCVPGQVLVCAVMCVLMMLVMVCLYGQFAVFAGVCCLVC